MHWRLTVDFNPRKPKTSVSWLWQSMKWLFKIVLDWLMLEGNVWRTTGPLISFWHFSSEPVILLMLLFVLNLTCSPRRPILSIARTSANHGYVGLQGLQTGFPIVSLSRCSLNASTAVDIEFASFTNPLTCSHRCRSSPPLAEATYVRSFFILMRRAVRQMLCMHLALRTDDLSSYPWLQIAGGR